MHLVVLVFCAMGMGNERCVCTWAGGVALERSVGNMLVVAAAVNGGQYLVGAADTRDDADWHRLFV